MRDRHLLTAFWSEIPQGRTKERPERARSVGVSAYSLQDAMSILRSELLGGLAPPEGATVRAGVHLSDLDQRHVVPNCWPLCFRGVSYPMI